MKILPVWAEYFRAYGQTHRRTHGQTDRYDEPNSHSSQLCESAQ